MSLISAVKSDNFKEVRKLIKKGVNVNLQDCYKNTALHIAISSSYMNITNPKIFTYLSKKCLLNIQDNHGNLSLWLIHNSKKRILLCKLGCKLFIQNRSSNSEITFYMKYNYANNCAIDLYIQILI